MKSKTETRSKVAETERDLDALYVRHERSSGGISAYDATKETRSISDRIAEVERDLDALYGAYEPGEGDGRSGDWGDDLRRQLEDGPDF